MLLKRLSLYLLPLSVLTACGGGGGASAPDTTAPVVSNVAASAASAGQVILTAAATDGVAVTGYCVTTTANAPTASDACFTSSNAQAVTAPAVATTYYVWAKDAEGNLSPPFSQLVNDSVTPAITAFNVSAPANGQVTLTATASDATNVAGYCFTTSATAPAPGDSCFQSSPSTSIAVPQSSPQYVWVKDDDDNINAPSAAGCSAAGIAASAVSTLPTVCVSTSLGEFVLELESTQAPITTTNFLKYVNDGFYSDTVFHRVISNFMVQGGGFTGVPIGAATTPSGTVYPPIVLETTATTGLSNTTGTIAMARTPALNSATNQFFINVVDNTFLNTSSGGYAAFGRVISGMDTTIQAIRGVAVQGETPVNPPVIHWAYQLK